MVITFIRLNIYSITTSVFKGILCHVRAIRLSFLTVCSTWRWWIDQIPGKALLWIK